MTNNIVFQPLATNLVNCEGSRCEKNILYEPQKIGEKCGKVNGNITRICDIGLNCTKTNDSQFNKCVPLNEPCIKCDKYRRCNDRDDSNCVIGFQDCKPYSLTNFKQCSAIFKP